MHVEVYTQKGGEGTYAENYISLEKKKKKKSNFLLNSDK